MKLCFDIKLFDRPEDLEWSEKTLFDFLRVLAHVNVAYLEQNPGTPSLYTSGVRYQMEPPGQENWRSIPVIMNQGHGDCEDLSAWRVAELWQSGERKAGFSLVRQKKPGVDFLLYHIRVRRKNGEIEDPSVALGMAPIS